MYQGGAYRHPAQLYEMALDLMLFAFLWRHRGSLFQDKDVEHVLDRFHELFDNSLIRQRFAIDTSSASAEESLQEFVKKVDPYIAPEDRQRFTDHQAKSGA